MTYYKGARERDEAKVADTIDKAFKPPVKLVGEDGNAFAIIGRCIRAAKLADWSQERINKFRDEATAGDYNHLLRTVMQYFDVEVHRG